MITPSLPYHKAEIYAGALAKKGYPIAGKIYPKTKIQNP